MESEGSASTEKEVARRSETEAETETTAALCGDPVFLDDYLEARDGSELTQEEVSSLETLMQHSVALASYPRCGNSLLRTLLEKTTGIITGTDSRPDRSLIQQLTAMGFKGEGVVDPTKVLFVKTHFPERPGYRPVKCTAGVVLMRNPFDAILSYFNMVLTQTHTKSVEKAEYDKFRDIWVQFVAEEAVVFAKFYEAWLELPKMTGFPVKVIRFEDLVLSRSETIGSINEFVEASCSGYEPFARRVDARLAHLHGLPQRAANRYTPRSNLSDMDTPNKAKSAETSGAFFRSISYYDSTQVEAF